MNRRPEPTSAQTVRPTAPGGQESAPRHFIDLVMVAPGGLFLSGWADDTADPIRWIEVLFPDLKVRVEASQIGRHRRGDVETALSVQRASSFGVCVFAVLDRPTAFRSACQVHVCFRSGVETRSEVVPQVTDDISLRDTVLSLLHSFEFCGNRNVEAFYLLDRSLGDALITHNRRISAWLTRSASPETFGKGSGKCRGSIVVCLYGKPEFLFLQNALFDAMRTAPEYEFIYVCNSPELIETLHREAAISQRIYGTHQTIVALSANAGFGAANNVAARYARSDRLLIVNPDVFPIRPDWAARHSAVLDAGSVASTRLFGAPLYYADGSLMHAGMYCEVDMGISVADGVVRRRPLLRIEHYGKGAPPTFQPLLESRPVPAVSGAFMSINRRHFEALGGFSEEYILGHYEDADLCFRSIGRGVVPWLQDVPFWHLEGRGGHRQPHHEAAATVNRWHFSRTWQAEVAEGLGARSPDRLAVSPEVAVVTPEPGASRSSISKSGSRGVRA